MSQEPTAKQKELALLVQCHAEALAVAMTDAAAQGMETEVSFIRVNSIGRGLIGYAAVAKCQIPAKVVTS